MSQIVRRRRFNWLASVIMLFSLVTPLAATLPAQDAAAAYSAGYFTGRPFRGSTFNVIDGGIPSGTNKTGFINHILGKLGSGAGTANYVGASYVIQTMRGGTDHGWPDSGDINDFVRRVNSPDVTYQWMNHSASINTARFFNGTRDVTRYNGSGSYWTMVFFHKKTKVYAVKQVCANPVGGLPGLPAIPTVNYNLTPTISSPQETTDGGSDAVLEPTMDNTGSTASSSVLWQITGFRVPAGGSIPAGRTNKILPSTYFGNGTQGVHAVSPSPKSSSFAAKQLTTTTMFPMTLAERTVKLGDHDIGTRICFALSVRQYSHTVTTSDWRHSSPYCIDVTKNPKVQILGSDLFVGKAQDSKITTSRTTKTVNGKDVIFGSWGEYALVASGTIAKMASAGGYSGGASTSAYCNLLSFTNEDEPKCGDQVASKKGNYSSPMALPSIGSRFVVTKPTLNNDSSYPSFKVENLSKGVYTATGNITLEGASEIAPKKWIVLNMPDANVRIRDDIIYKDKDEEGNALLHSLSDIPQVVIIANKITIDNRVQNIDAWLIASGDDGTIDTCHGVVDWEDLTSDKCDNKLTVNGPVVAKHLILQRTAGSGADERSGDPAEVFNLRPDAYLWATAWAADAGRLQTVFSKELPPRF